MPEQQTTQPCRIYDPAAVEARWQAYWETDRTFVTPNPGQPGFAAAKPKLYILDMYPYPSAAGLHVGHPEGYTATDILTRYRRMQGYNVLHPMGYDAFGLPAEQYAVETGVHPAETTRRNIDNIRRQIRSLGFSYDWDRELATTDVDYYRWTQWIFLQMYNSWYDPQQDKARPIRELEDRIKDDPRFRDEAARRAYIDGQRLAYQDEVPVNWCPMLGTVLANEEVTNEGRSDRGNYPVYRRPLRQWMLRITRYADRLARDLDKLEWPEAIKTMQRNWIGRSEGADVDFLICRAVPYAATAPHRALALGPLDAPSIGEWLTTRGENGFPERCEEHVIRVFTTRPDTLYGATYMVLAPEHPLVKQITTDKQRAAVERYCRQAEQKSDMDRTAAIKGKTGVFTGAYAINPVNHERIPIWVADYVLMGYGTGAIMAVPAHDERDMEFAKLYGLPIPAVVMPLDEWLLEQAGDDAFDRAFMDKHGLAAPRKDAKEVADLYRAAPGAFSRTFVGDGVSINSPAEGVQSDPCAISGAPSGEAKARITAVLEQLGLGRSAVNYKLRDWLFSRQRYWGEPFPIVHCPKCGTVALPESALPVELPAMKDFTPTASEDPNALPEPPLARARDWAQTTCPCCKSRAQREVNTMPQWAGSCWYYLRFLDPHNDAAFVDPQVERYWMAGGKTRDVQFAGVDLYVGGAEHAVLHLLYARFWHKVLHDLGYVSTPEPFGRLFNQGMIRSFAYRDSRGIPVGYDDVEFREDGPYHRQTGELLSESVEKMAKSLKNVVSPDQVVEQYGADTLRLYEMYMGPLETSKPWNPRDVPGVHRFLHRAWRLIVDPETGELADAVQDAEPDEQTQRLLHRTVQEVTEDLEEMAFNTAIAHMIVFVNEMTKATVRPRSVLRTFMLLLSPFAPHIAEELWQRLLGREWTGSLAYEPWPTFDETLVQEEQIEVPVQVNGKLRSRVRLSADADEQAARSAALADTKIQQTVADRQMIKFIYVPGRMINIVIR
jgi:leucyl-tRNA synthetase